MTKIKHVNPRSTVVIDSLSLAGNSAFLQFPTAIMASTKERVQIGEKLFLQRVSKPDHLHEIGKCYNKGYKLFFGDEQQFAAVAFSEPNNWFQRQRTLIRFKNSAFYNNQLLPNLFRELLENEFLDLTDITVREYHVAIDTNVPLLDDARRLCVEHDAERIKFHSQKKCFEKRTPYREVQFGHCFIYNKTEEMAQNGNKKPYITEVHQMNGLGNSSVHRLEIRLGAKEMREVLTAIDLRDLTNPQIIQQIANEYVARDLTYSIPNGTKNPSRWKREQLLDLGTERIKVEKPNKGSDDLLSPVKFNSLLEGWYYSARVEGTPEAEIVNKLMKVAQKRGVCEKIAYKIQTWSENFPEMKTLFQTSKGETNE